MSPETADYLAMARDDLAEAVGIMGIGPHRAAARSVCHAAFHAAEALIVARQSG